MNITAKIPTNNKTGLNSKVGINKIFLLGHIETNPKKHFTYNSCGRICFVLRTKEIIKKNDQPVEHLEYHNLSIDVNHPDIKAIDLVKGKLLYVTGKIQTRATVDADGIRRYKTEIVVTQLEHFNL